MGTATDMASPRDDDSRSDRRERDSRDSHKDSSKDSSSRHKSHKDHKEKKHKKHHKSSSSKDKKEKKRSRDDDDRKRHSKEEKPTNGTNSDADDADDDIDALMKKAQQLQDALKDGASSPIAVESKTVESKTTTTSKRNHGESKSVESKATTTSKRNHGSDDSDDSDTERKMKKSKSKNGDSSSSSNGNGKSVHHNNGSTKNIVIPPPPPGRPKTTTNNDNSNKRSARSTSRSRSRSRTPPRRAAAARSKSKSRSRSRPRSRSRSRSRSKSPVRSSYSMNHDLPRRRRSRSRTPPRRRRSPSPRRRRSRSRSRTPPRRRRSRSRSRTPPRRRPSPRRRSRSRSPARSRTNRNDNESRNRDNYKTSSNNNSNGRGRDKKKENKRQEKAEDSSEDDMSDDSDDELSGEAKMAKQIEKNRQIRAALAAKYSGSKPSTPLTPADGFGQGSALNVPDPVAEDVKGDSPASLSPSVSPSNMPSNLDKASKTTDTVDAEDDIFSEEFDTSKLHDMNGLGQGNYKDTWDDKDGYYKIRAGEVFNHRYKIMGYTGQGVFSNVVRAVDTIDGGKVAIKIIRNNDLMYRAAVKEMETIRKINSLDKNNQYYCVRFKGHFMHKRHLCLIFENCAMNLREVTKRYGREDGEIVGLNMAAVQKYTKQMLLALKLLRQAHILHGDIKPDNILVNENKTQAKLCDFGSACTAAEMEVTPYLCSRFYRAPEIMLGHDYEYGIDMWALACTLFELYTGNILFQGATNNGMLKVIMDLKGKPSSRFIKKGAYHDQHFDFENNFQFYELDTVTKKAKIRILKNLQPTVDMMGMLKRSQKLDSDEMKKLTQFKDLLEKMLIVDPARRITPKEALAHDFLKA